MSLPSQKNDPIPKRTLFIALFLGVGLLGALATGYFLYRMGLLYLPMLLARTQMAERVLPAGYRLPPTPNARTEADNATRGLRFRERQWEEGFRLRGQAKPTEAIKIQRMIREWIDFNFARGPARQGLVAPRALADELAALPRLDPLAMTVAALNCPEMQERTRRLETALRSFEGSTHRAYPRFSATLVLADATSREARARIAQLDAQAIALFQKCFEDGSLLPEDDEEVVTALTNGGASGWFNRNHGAILELEALKDPSRRWLRLTLEGTRQVVLAWDARGDGWSNEVSPKGWAEFGQHLAIAGEDLEAAWKLHPERPAPAVGMIPVAMGRSDGKAMVTWFERAIQGQIDHDKAWSNLMWGLRPRWLGSAEEVMTLGEAALATRRFDTNIPLKYFDAVWSQEADAKVGPDQHLYGRPEYWPRLKEMYDGYLADPSQAWNLEGWRSTYACIAYLAGHREVAREQMQALQWKPRSLNLYGRGRDLSLLPLAVDAQTGAHSQDFLRAESLETAGSLQSASGTYAGLLPNLSKGTRERQYAEAKLAILAKEIRLANGEWVDVLPANLDDPTVNVLTTPTKIHSTGMDVEVKDTGFMQVGRLRVGRDFEVKCEFEVLETTNGAFQWGVVFGLPHPSAGNWLAFRVKKNAEEGSVALIGTGWTRPDATAPIQLNPKGLQRIELRYDHERVSASVNGSPVLQRFKPPRELWVAPSSMQVGIGAYVDQNRTRIRVRSFRVHRLNLLSPQGTRP